MKDAQSGDSIDLRRRAERKLKELPPDSGGQESPAQMRRLLHELQVHQIELEMQNEELQESRASMEAALERATELYDFAPMGYFTLTRECTIRELNLPGARLLNQDRIRLVGGRFRLFVSEGSRPQFDTWFKDVFATDVKQICSVELIRENLPPLPVEIEATLSSDRREARAIVADITQRKILEDRLNQAQKMEVVGRLAGGVAHDFNNILGAMILNLEIMPVVQQLPEQTQTSLRDLETLAKRAASLTQQLLLFSRRQAMQLVPLEINASLSNLLRMVERLLGEDITCSLVPGSEELWVEADVTTLDQVVLNLCLNARDAMPRGGTITLETTLSEFTADHAHSHPDSHPGTFVCLRISDTGSGMDVEVLKHLFEPFFTTKELGKGTGLGLASAYGVLQQHNGWIEVESIVGNGTTFRLYLPSFVKGANKKALDPPSLPSGQRNKTILIVEDEAALLFISTRALTLLGYQILSATNGEEALAIWEQHQDGIDLLLTDMRMPKGMNGLELAGEFWKTKPLLKIIIMSGYSMEVATDTLAGATAYTFLAKPFSVKTLSEAVQHAMA